MTKSVLVMLFMMLSIELAFGQNNPKSQVADDHLQDELNWLRAEALTVVTASKYAQKINDAPAKMVVWTDEMIRRCGLTTLDELLAHTPGFYYGFNADYASFSVRGMHPIAPGLPQPNILFMIDGVRINEATFFGHYYNYYHNLDFVKQVEIILGPGGALYGLNAIVGVVNIITQKGPDSMSCHSNTSIHYDYPLEQMGITKTFQINNGKGLKLFGGIEMLMYLHGEWETGVERLGAVDWYQLTPWHTGLNRQGGSMPNWNLNVQYNKWRFFTYRTSIMYPEFNAPWWDITADRFRSFERRIYDLAFTPDFANTEIHLNYNQHWDFHESKGNGLWFDTLGVHTNLYGLTNVNEMYGSIQSSPLKNESHHIIEGLEFAHAERRANFLGDKTGRSLDQWRYSALVQWENRTLDKITFLAGLRYDIVTINSKDAAQNQKKLIDYFGALSPRVSIQYTLSADHRLRLIYARSSRQFVLGDFIDSLWAKKTDYIDDFELNINSIISDNLTSDINFFYMNAPYSSLAIHNNFQPTTGRTEFTTAGIESDLKARIKAFDVSLGFTYWQAKTDQIDQAGLDRMPYAPQMMFKLNLNGPLVPQWVSFALLVNGNVNVMHVDDLSGANQEEWSYFPINLILTSDPQWPLPFQLTLGVKNLLNQKYNYPGYGKSAPFFDWNAPDYMVQESRVQDPGLSLYTKLTLSF